MFIYDLGNGADLRLLEMRHAPALYELTVANRDYIGEWVGWANTMNGVEDAQNLIQRGMNRFAEDGLPWFGIWLNNAMVGGILFFPLERRIMATEVGYWLGQAAAGQGLMSRSLVPVLNYAFNDIGVQRMALQAGVNNKRSRALAERMGFTFEGIRRHGWINRDGDPIDLAAYAMLAEDWQAKRG